MDPKFGSVLIELTTRCDLSCEHCVHPENIRATNDELPFEMVETLLHSLTEAGVLLLILTGGEPLLYSRLFEIIAAARERKFLVRMKSNGQLLDETMAQRLKQAGVYAIDVSLYGPEASYHDRITRCSGSFERSCRALRNIVRAGIKGRILTPLFHPMIDLDAMSAFARSIPVPILYDPFVHDTFDHRPAIAAFDLTTEELKEYIRYMVRLGEYLMDTVPHRRPLCKIGTEKTIYIDHAGNLKPCGNYPAVTGNIMTTTVEQALDEWRSLRADLDAHRLCATCELSHYCNPCAAISFLETGDACGCSPRLRRFAEAYRAVAKELKGKTSL